MKKNLSAFMSGVLAITLVFGIGTSALAASGRLTITVDPINIQVNGQTFAPKDANGKPVDVFAYNGTTYAPLRALAEAYGLEVGYDAKTNMATVVDPKAPTNTTAPSTDYSEWSAEEEAAYQEFKGMWEVKRSDIAYSANIGMNYNKDNLNDLIDFVDKFTEETVKLYCKRLRSEIEDVRDIMIYGVDKTPLWGDICGVNDYDRTRVKNTLIEMSEQG